MNPRRALIALPAALALLSLIACAETPPAAETPPSAESAEPNGAAGHGEVRGAAEVAEPPLALLTIDEHGGTGLLDLLDGQAEQLAEVAPPLALASDGRYAFVSVAGGVEIVDSGRWTWDHVDHFHYYRAEPRTVGLVPGDGAARVSTGMLSTAGTTGVFFPGSGEAVLLDNAALSRGEIVEVFRIETGSDDAVIAPLGDRAVISTAHELVLHDSDGRATGATAPCTGASGTLTTRVGLVVGCDGGAVLISDGADPVFEEIPYPAGVDAARTGDFAGRKGRPTIAAAAAPSGFWLLDTRERTWQHVATEVPLLRVVAADDAEGHVVALDAEGRVRVYRAETGEQIGATDPLVADVSGGIALTLDDQRAYLNDPARNAVHEIAYAGEVRVARTLEPRTPPYVMAEVGR